MRMKKACFYKRTVKEVKRFASVKDFNDTLRKQLGIDKESIRKAKQGKPATN